MSLVPLPDVKSHLNITSPADDTELQAMLDAAESAICRRLGGTGTLAATSVTQRAPGRTPALVLNYLPVVSLTSVTGVYSGALTPGDLDFDATDGLVYWLPQSSPVTFVDPYYTVVYQTGYANLAALPDDLVLAVKEQVDHLWTSQRGSGQSRPGTRPTEPIQFASQVGALPPRVQELINPYLRSGFA